MRKINKPRWEVLGVAAIITAFGFDAQSAVLNVCPSGCSYSLPSGAMNAAAAGDTIQIQAATYNDCVVVNKNNITIVGINGRAKLVNRVCLQKGIIVTTAQNAVIRNIELSGATNGENYAGVRHDGAGFNLTLDNVYIHDNDDGLLSSASGDTVLIQNSRFENNGMNNVSGMAHNMYIGRSASFSFINSVSVRAKLAGHEVKTRALKTLIDGSTIATLDGHDSRNIDAANGGQVTIRNSVLEKGPNSDNNDMIAYGAEGIDSTKLNTFEVTGTKFIGDRANVTAFRLFATPTSKTITGNTSVAVTGLPSGNTVFASRTAAGYQTYPWLPAVAVPTSPTPTPTPTPTPVTWTKCATENQQCVFTGTRDVRYGTTTVFFTKTFTGGVACNNSVFGDPIKATLKSCWYGPLK
jgi:hypothetical protein